MNGNMPVINPDNSITFPNTIEDCTKSFLHNLAKMYYDCLKDIPNALPKKILLFGTKNEVDFEQKKAQDDNFFYSHELIEKIDTDPDYEFDPNMTKITYEYKGVTIYFLVEKNIVNAENRLIPAVNQVQMSYGLGAME